MDIVLLAKAAVMGIVEGLTEFLPISSTGHLILAGSLLGGFGDNRGKVFEIAIQTGAIFAVILVYWQKIKSTVVALPRQPKAQRLALNIFIGFLPAVVLGLLFGKVIKEHLFIPTVVASTFIIGGFIILWAEKRPPGSVRVEHVDDMTPWDALKVGLVQCFAMIPGTSRSGSTIIGGMLLGLLAPGGDRFLVLPRYSYADRRRALQHLQGARGAVDGRHPAVRRGAGVLVHQRLAVRALAAEVHQHPQLHSVRLVPHCLRHPGAGHGVDRHGGLGRLIQS